MKYSADGRRRRRPISATEARSIKFSRATADQRMTLIKPYPAQTSTQVPAKSEVERVLAPLEEIARNSPNLIVNPGARFESGGALYELPRYLFFGDHGGDTPIRIGIFAAIHGADPEG